MATLLELEIEGLKKKHALLELSVYNQKLQEKYEDLKKLEGTVQVRIVKSNKKTRHVSIVYHVLYEMKEDSWVNKSEVKHNYIGRSQRIINIMEAPVKPYKKYSIDTSEIFSGDYNGKIHVDDGGSSYDYSTHKTISVEVFEAIWKLCKVTTKNILDGLLDISEVKWLMNGTDEDHEFKDNNVDEYQRFALDLPHIFLTQEESWKLNNKFTRIFLNKNIFLITPNSLKALDEWLADEAKWDDFSASACASVGERWRGSKMDQNRELVRKIKSTL